MRISRWGLPPRNGCLIAAVVLKCCSEQPGEVVERRHPRSYRAIARPWRHFATAAVAGLAAGKICDRVGAKLAASGAAIDCRWTVSGGVLGRTVAGVALCCARRRVGPVRARGAGRAVFTAPVSLG